MRKLLSTIFVAVCFLIVATNSNAQEKHFGIKGGAAAYQMTSEVGGVSNTSDPKIGFEAGIFGDFPINRILSIQPEVVFVQKGGEEASESIGTSSVTLNYVDVPLLLKINAPLDGIIKPYIFGGPYAGYLLEATSESEGNNQEITEFLEELHYGLKVGLGLHIGSVVIDARYDMGVANLYTEDVSFGNTDTEVTLKTSGVVVSLGITF